MGQEQRIQHLMSADEFYAWLESQSERHELVDGQPLLMAGATIAHDTVVMNASRLIGNQLLGKPCRPRSADIAVKISTHQVRYPDLSVDCGDPAGTSREAAKPTLVIEVESPSTGMVGRRPADSGTGVPQTLVQIISWMTASSDGQMWM